MKRKILAFMITLVFALSVMIMPVYAASHPNPSTGGTCTNITRAWSHVGYYGSSSSGYHILSDGRSCTKSRLTYLHRIYCASCHYTFNSSYMDSCSEAHSTCNIFIEVHSY